MSERKPGHPEGFPIVQNTGDKRDIAASPEHIPSRDEVRSIFERVVGRGYENKRTLADEQGMYLWEVTLKGTKPGDETELSYARKGRFDRSQSSTTTIQILFFEDGMPVGGYTVADLVDGEWVMRDPPKKGN